MAGRPKKEPPQMVENLDPAQVADLAADAAVKLHLSGIQPTVDTIWVEVRQRDDKARPPVYFCQVLDGPAFKALLDIRLRRVTLSSVKEVSFLRDLCRDIAKIAGDSLLEDLLLRPGSIKPADKRAILKDVGALYDNLVAKERKADGLPAAPAETPEQALIEQATAMEDALSRVPEELRDRHIKEWKLGELRAVQDREEELRRVG